MSTLPQDAIDKLPFSAEPMFQWNKDTDIRAFVTALFSSSHYSDIGPGDFPTEEKNMRECARLFTKNLMEYPQPSTYLDFYQDARFGQVAKYAIAFKICLSSLLADGAFYSLAHILESGDDTESSLLLASNFYYKQATQMLRNILEEIFLPIHFCDTVQDFDAWKRNNYRTPKLRGDDGLIKRLLRKNIIHEPLASRVANIYGNLSAYVHGSENTLTYQKIHLGEIPRREFTQDMFQTWCKLFCECIEICIRLLKINYDQWHSISSLKIETLAKIGKTLCPLCHNEDAFDRWLLPSKYFFIRREEEDELFPEGIVLENAEEISFYRYDCQRCGHQTIINVNETPLKSVICFSTDDQPSHVTDYAVLMRSTKDPYCEWYILTLGGTDKSGTDIITSLLVHLSI